MISGPAWKAKADNVQSNLGHGTREKGAFGLGAKSAQLAHLRRLSVTRPKAFLVPPGRRVVSVSFSVDSAITWPLRSAALSLGAQRAEEGISPQEKAQLWLL